MPMPYADEHPDKPFTLTSPWRHALALACLMVLSGCDQLGIDTPAKVEERMTAEAKAVGTACRHAMRAIEDCYTLNPKMQKAAIADGWREMDEYMRENKIDGVEPTVAKALPKPHGSKDADAEDATDEEDSGSSDNAADKGAASDAEPSRKASDAASDGKKPEVTGKHDKGGAGKGTKAGKAGQSDTKTAKRQGEKTPEEASHS